MGEERDVDSVLQEWATLYLDELEEEEDITSLSKKTMSLRSISPKETFNLFDEDISEMDSEPQDDVQDTASQPFKGLDVVSEIGRGGMGLVCIAKQNSLERNIALKTALHPRMKGLLIQEARVTGALNHPNIMSELCQLCYN